MHDGELLLEGIGKGRRSGGVVESSTRKLLLEQRTGASNCIVSFGLITEAIFLNHRRRALLSLEQLSLRLDALLSSANSKNKCKINESMN